MEGRAFNGELARAVACTTRTLHTKRQTFIDVGDKDCLVITRFICVLTF